MPTGTKIVSATSVTDATLPLLNSDLAMPSAATLAAKGLLGIWDMNHSANPAASGAASGLAIPNVAWAECAALLGSGTAATLAAAFATDASYVAGTTGQFERTGKGGLHGIVSQTNNTAANQGASITLPTPVQTYILANPTHSYFFSLWDRITRASLATSIAIELAGIYNNASSDANYLAKIKAGTSDTNHSGGTLGIAMLLALNTLGNNYVEIGQSGFVGTVPAAGSLQAGAFWGSTAKAGASQNSNTSNFNKLPSHIFYRMHLEDLTVSGRTFAQAAAADQAAYALAFNNGGRFNGDTFTAPNI